MLLTCPVSHVICTKSQPRSNFFSYEKLLEFRLWSRTQVHLNSSLDDSEISAIFHGDVIVDLGVGQH